ncbi:enoyl-CoA hydratase [Hypericibacter adhaerens]|jgi:methylglutaconyl-CoA hydratase|uniref:Enoyl-CoA hydratase n=1 Tax=Hypericibacter adhaerens TaxID=2602016 RepID=A0A5J6N015_9PROT|nr:enoyl-CoA hydratase-related protein [Hypericibacter adhaerens]QEX21930.1 enoyl-CoA hydratase [Hypericibacter adhaerens]
MSRVLKERNGPVLRLVLNRPEKHNAFDEVQIDELTRAIDEAENDPSVRLLVLTANGKSFSAGADLDWMRRMAAFSEEENLADAGRLALLLQRLNFIPKPTIAAVQGAAVGGGVGLVSACDIAVGTAQAVFGLTEVRIGLIPATIGPYVVQAIGERAARRYFLTGERFDAATARELGLLHEVVEDLEAAVARYSEMLLQGGPEAQAATKKLIRRVGRGPINVAMIEDTAARIAKVRKGAEAREGIAAFFEKRKPGWQS